MTSVASKGRLLAFGETFLKNPNSQFEARWNAYQKLTKKDVYDAYLKYIKGKPAVHLSVYPLGEKKIIAKKDNYTPKLKDSNYKNDLSEYEGLSYTEPKDNFDRSVQPPAGPNIKLKLPKLNFGKVSNASYAYTKWDETPTVDIKITIPMGHWNESVQNAGITQLMTSLMGESTQNFSAEEVSEALAELGSEVYVGSGVEDL